MRKNSLWLLLLAILLIATMWLPTQGNRITLEQILATPQLSSDWLDWLGYDELGRSVSARLLEGLQTAMVIAITVVLLSMLLGVSVGIVAGFIGGWVDALILRIIDMFLAFPGLLLAILFSALLGPGLSNLVFALAVVGWVGFARITRAQVLSLRTQDYIIAAQAQGVSSLRIMVRYLLPMLTSVILVEATFAFAAAILAEAGLSFLGLGIQPPDASWGQMVRIGAQYMLVAPHLVIAPGAAIWLSVLLINLAG